LTRAHDLPERPHFDYLLQGGVAYQYDNNIFLTDGDEKSDSIWIPFARGRVDYREPQLELVADLMGNYKHYVVHEEAEDTEVRFFGRAGYTGSQLSAGLVQLVRSESEPTDAQFFDRVERITTNTIPQFAYSFSDSFAMETSAHVQLVRFDEKIVADARDNINYRLELSLVYRSDLDYIVQGGGYWIDYTNEENAAGIPTAPPDVDGVFARVGVRGELFPDFYANLLAGYTKAESEDFETIPPVDGKDHSTGDVFLFVRYHALDTWTASAGYVRVMGFTGGIDPFQIVNRVYAFLDVEATEELKLHARFQFERVDSALGVERDYASLGARATYRWTDNLITDAGVTYRFGGVSGNVANSLDYDDVILQIGVAVEY
jgi:hypothetical protein